MSDKCYQLSVRDSTEFRCGSGEESGSGSTNHMVTIRNGTAITLAVRKSEGEILVDPNDTAVTTCNIYPEESITVRVSGDGELIIEKTGK